MSDAEKYYYEFGGCSCHTMPPCSFCTSMTEEEANVMGNEGYQGLEKFWKDQVIELTEKLAEESQWVVMFDFDHERGTIS